MRIEGRVRGNVHRVLPKALGKPSVVLTKGEYLGVYKKTPGLVYLADAKITSIEIHQDCLINANAGFQYARQIGGRSLQRIIDGRLLCTWGRSNKKSVQFNSFFYSFSQTLGGGDGGWGSYIHID